MKVQSIRIERFRSFADETIRLDGYTCLVGVNGSGKSTVLAALNVLFQDQSGGFDVTKLEPPWESWRLPSFELGRDGCF